MNPYAELLDRADRDLPAAEPTRGRSADAARRSALDDHRRLRAELQATLAAEGIQL